jgi:hypothetical protein
MINEIFVFDNIIEENLQDIVELYCKESTNNWECMENITFSEDDVTFDADKFPAKIIPSGNINEDSIKNIIELIQKNTLAKTKLEYVKNYRIKINWTAPIDIDETIEYKLLHVDKYEEHIVIIYYVNDTDGDTLIFNNKNGNNSKDFYKQFDGTIDINNFELKKSISPKKGRVVMFNGNLYHYGKYPKIKDRFVINMNLVAKNKINKILI